ncbi:DUF3180 domain-containing protein [Amycolatopsis sp. K13G38]|uniref:DUF3180 domain-containing protein n=1 Tax=Amycolatopsis acididurans TaxID=2724524 RepID=A0ABX1JG08_9PSEU|nr:DUF3180 domain-containing protein [Amycolatopsis acididurans]NKQ58339.1 DUF3180 domain-containing protein [Amycolatopsis acididurans]
MHFTRPRELVTAGLVGLVLSYLVFEFQYNALPRLPTFAGVTLLVLGVIEVALAFSIRSRIRNGRVFGSLAVARAVALAKASSLLGALMFGAWGGVLIALVPRAGEAAAPAADVRSAVIGLVSAVALVGAALWLEHCCRTPDQGDQDRDSHPTG